MIQTTKSLYLSDLSPKDKVWDKHKAQADVYQALYIGTSYHKYSERICNCSKRLVFRVGTEHNKKRRFRLKTAMFCRIPTCPVCQGRRALKWNAKIKQIMPKVLEDSPKSRFIMLCFTVENPELKDLRSQLDQMNKAWTRLTKRKEWKVYGWLRTVEVTRADDDKVHPHYHALLMVSQSYFGGHYITHERWRELWRDCLRVDYLPQVNVQAVKPRKGTLKVSELAAVVSATVEVVKYAVKPSSILRDDCDQQIPGQRVRASNQEWLVELTEQMHRMRLITSGGILKDYFRELEDERKQKPEGYIHTRETTLAESSPDDLEAVSYWNSGARRYGEPQAFV